MNLQVVVYKFMCTMFILLGMASCHCLSPDEELQYDRTVLVYMAAENSLSGGNFHQQDIDEMLLAGTDIPGNSRLLVYLDDTSLPRILSIERQGGRRPVIKVLHSFTAEHNSGDSETLRLVMEWMSANSPSQSYGLVFWSHGDAWLPGPGQ